MRVFADQTMPESWGPYSWDSGSHLVVNIFENFSLDPLHLWVRAELAGWDQQILSIELQHLIEVDLDFNIETIGWDMAEIEIMLDGVQKAEGQDTADDVPEVGETAVSRQGDLWVLGPHRILCGSALDPTAYDRLLQGRQVRLVLQHPP